MNSERPPTLRTRLLQVAAGVLGLLFFYVVGIGPATYLSIRSPDTHPLFEKLYVPLRSALAGTTLEKPVSAYCIWWGLLALSHGADRQYQSPPGD